MSAGDPNTGYPKLRETTRIIKATVVRDLNKCSSGPQGYSRLRLQDTFKQTTRITKGLTKNVFRIQKDTLLYHLTRSMLLLQWLGDDCFDSAIDRPRVRGGVKGNVIITVSGDDE